MRLSNFRNHRTNNRGILDRIEYATVDVASGILFRKITTREIALKNLYWFFVDTGEFTPSGQAENLFRGYLAQRDM
jgi:hypothetical protein